MKAPGPGRDFDGCPNACGSILIKMTLIVTLFVVSARFVARKVRERREP